jgi:N-acetylmuramoyl-L-alanine amidase
MTLRRRLVLAVVASLTLTACLHDDRHVSITGRPTPTTTTLAQPIAKSVLPAPAKPPPLPSAGTAVRTSTGVLALWSGADGGIGHVRTPCGRDATVRSFEVVRDVDVVLDPGHGGLDPGAVSSTGVTEADLNLDIARRVRVLLVAQGFSVELTRDGDWFRSIADRSELAAALHPRAFVSIHHNSGVHPPQKLGPGTEVYHERNDDDSRRLAGLLWQDIVDGLSQFHIDWVASQYRGALWRADRDGDDFYGVLRRADTVPAVIIESAFLSGEAEAELVTTDEFRDVEAHAIANGITRFLQTSDEGTGFIKGFTLGGSARRFDMDECKDPALE